MRRLALSLLLLLWACSSRERADNPEGAVHLFIAAARSGDRAAVYQRLGPETRARIEALLSSSRHQGGRLIAKPEDFFSVGWAPPAWEPAGTRIVHREPDRAEVEVFSAAGDRSDPRTRGQGMEDRAAGWLAVPR
jgi:hypothetical protein